ncbi:Transglutaminase-like superfamily protein [Insolitispirillum peregrinum]|uniref:Transglutaminase-like superfamily protein n=1 Tax=Insolitispirillum peregrinum TaxID=80876 RepID=A0A1N7LDI5_9PROT|nr:Transglutaminase-like superfamily protein [Insolitispirillum peregrinum]
MVTGLRYTLRQWRGRVGLPVEAMVCLALARLACLVMPFRLALRLVGLRPVPQSADRTGPLGPLDPRISAVAGMIARMAARAPFRAVCLQQSFAAALMLRRRGLPVDVHLGVRRENGVFAAHAWSLSNGHPVTGVPEAGVYQTVAILRAGQEHEC